MRFELTSFTDEIEVRLFVGAKARLRIYGVEIVELDTPTMVT